MTFFSLYKISYHIYFIYLYTWHTSFRKLRRGGGVRSTLLNFKSFATEEMNPENVIYARKGITWKVMNDKNISTGGTEGSRAAPWWPHMTAGCWLLVLPTEYSKVSLVCGNWILHWTILRGTESGVGDMSELSECASSKLNQVKLRGAKARKPFRSGGHSSPSDAREEYYNIRWRNWRNLVFHYFKSLLRL